MQYKLTAFADGKDFTGELYDYLHQWGVVEELVEKSLILDFIKKDCPHLIDEVQSVKATYLFIY